MSTSNSTAVAPMPDKRAMPLDLDKIKALRLKRGLSQEQAAQLAGIAGRQHWNKIETGKISPSIDTLDRVAKALHVSPRDLLK
jgi:transcriptional regulator with XRE-family HTH domain